MIWFHGCSLKCPGCIAKEMNDSVTFTSWKTTQLAKRILSIEGIEGVTLSGGDPFDQPAEALAEFIEEVRTKSRLTFVCYTGRTLWQLQHAPVESFSLRVLGALDILIDGPYVEGLNDGSLWRGSSNQRVHFLSAHYAHWESAIRTEKNRKLEFNLSADGAFDVTGIPPAGFLDSLQSRLLEKGLSLTR